MSFSPHVILSTASRQRCVANLKELPTLIQDPSLLKTYAAVLIPMCIINDEVCILYTKRSMNLKNHSGQVSFPGGKADDNETAEETALRETFEEIGIAPQYVDVWGVMPGVQGRVKEMHITPVIGEIKNFSSNELVPSVYEVEEIFTVPLKELANPENHAHLTYKPPLPIFLYGKFTIWGITGLITHLFLQSLLPDDVYKPNFLRKAFTLEEVMPSKL